MPNISDFIGKPLFDGAGEKAGTVKNALLTRNLKTLRAFEYFDEQEDEHILPLSAISSAGDALIVRSLAEKTYKDAVGAPFGMTAYSVTGEELGKISDFELDGAAVTALILSGGTKIESARIASVKDAVFADLKSPLPLKPVKPRAKRKTAQASVLPAPDRLPAAAPQSGSADPSAAAPTRQADETSPQNSSAPPQTAAPKAGSALLTGKRAPADIKDARGNVIVKKGALITAETLRRAMANNKIFELTLSVLGRTGTAR